MRYLPDPQAVRRSTTAELRDRFLVDDLFEAEKLNLRFIDLDRVVLGGVVPTAGPLALPTPASLATGYFTERRELGILNVGGPGSVTAAGRSFAMRRRDGLYVGRGTQDIRFQSDSSSDPARFYLVSYPAHASFPTTHLAHGDAEVTELGTSGTANRRRLFKYFHPDGIRTAQLVMGVTEMESGSVWNTMPPHTHQRRTEVYLYFDLPEDAAVFHFMGEPDETRHLLVRDEEVVLSPGWSIHSGCGTSSYAFCWAMGGENQVFSDMQGVSIADLR
jgi:4-deoxy-L-threo-5-hexosulose-uronate ketol-isomerase